MYVLWVSHACYGLKNKSMSMELELNAEIRPRVGKGISRQLRRKEMLPAVLYGKSVGTKSIQVNALDVDKILRTKKGMNTFINLNIGGSERHTCLIKDYQAESITRNLTHVDFWSVLPDQEVSVYVAVKLVGKAPGLKQGGVMEQISFDLKVIVKAGQIPEEIEVDVNALDVGQSIHLADLTLPAGVRVKEGFNPTIVSMISEKRAMSTGAMAEQVVEAPVVAEGAVAPAAEGSVAGAEGVAGALAAKTDAKPEEKDAEKTGAKAGGKPGGKPGGKLGGKTSGKSGGKDK